ncbi:MAG: F-actin-capping protein subunit alpha [Cirrosporium novae-zelandiae]|nr:MAG: F-actin-capping protein subunit alpha [Cirrosporium novae-zelandiae]
MSSTAQTASAFIEGAPPGEQVYFLKPPFRTPEFTLRVDIKALTIKEPNVLSSLGPAFKKYHEEQFTAVKLPGGSQQVIISSHNEIEEGRYYDIESQSSFSYDHTTQEASAVQSYNLESQHSDLVKSILKSLSSHAKEHYPSPSTSYGVYPIENDSAIAILTVASKYSPNNFWNGRWRSLYIYSPSSNSLKGSIRVDVHYYEDGNVRLLTEKPLSSSVSSGSAPDIVRQIAQGEKKYQEDLNRAFGQLSEGAFKGLRRQLPVTRQKIEWEKISSYRLGQDIGGGRSR